MLPIDQSIEIGRPIVDSPQNTDWATTIDDDRRSPQHIDFGIFGIFGISDISGLFGIFGLSDIVGLFGISIILGLLGLLDLTGLSVIFLYVMKKL